MSVSFNGSIIKYDGEIKTMIERKKYMTKSEEEKLESSIKDQIKSLKENLKNPELLQQKESWKRLSVVTEGEGGDE